MIHDGGFAFPFKADRVDGTEFHFGMSLRDYFAAEALSGMLAHSRNGHGYRPIDKSKHWHDAIAEESYEIADAMIRAGGY